MISTKARAVSGPTPGCVISRSTSGRFLASRSTAAVSSLIVGFMRSSNSNNSCRRRLAQGANESFSNCARPLFAEQFFLPAIALVHGQRLQLIHDPCAHLHHAMTMPQQLSQIPILRTRYPDLRKVIFPHQSQQESGVLTVVLLLLHSLGFDLCWMADPQLETQFSK